MLTPFSESDHYKALIDALGNAGDHATNLHRDSLLQAIQDATVEATALGFYRNQPQWMKIAASLDEAAKQIRAANFLDLRVQLLCRRAYAPLMTALRGAVAKLYISAADQIRKPTYDA